MDSLKTLKIPEKLEYHEILQGLIETLELFGHWISQEVKSDSCHITGCSAYVLNFTIKQMIRDISVMNNEGLSSNNNSKVNIPHEFDEQYYDKLMEYMNSKFLYN